MLKGCYQCLCLSEKDHRASFGCKSVWKCIDSDEVLTIGHPHCLFSKQAREYMLAYSILNNSDESGRTEGAEEVSESESSKDSGDDLN